MSNRQYNEEYYIHEYVTDYSDSAYWTNSFGKIADQLIDKYEFKTVLECGCAWGYLVAALRDRGIEAYGIDISEYAVSMAREDIKPYLNAQSVLDPLPKSFPEKFDLLISIEMIEHLYEEDGLKAIEKMCTYANTILLTSSADEVTEKTHYNVQQPEYWVKHFAKVGYYNDYINKPSFITPHSFYFEKSNNIPRVVENYEHTLRLLKYDFEKLLKASNDEKEHKFKSTIYFDTGSGYNNNEIMEFTLENEKVQIDIILPPNCKSVRFDPIELFGCIVKDVVAKTLTEFVTPNIINGFKFGEFDLFVNADPQYEIDLTNNSSSTLYITATVVPLESLTSLLMLDYLCKNEIENNKYKDLTTKELETIREALADVTTKYNTKLNDVFSLEKAIDEKNVNLNKYQLENNNLLQEKEIQKQEIDKLNKKLQSQEELLKQTIHTHNSRIDEYAKLVVAERGELNHIKNERDLMLSSTSWRITKPARSVVRVIKNVLRTFPITRLAYKALYVWKHEGYRAMVLKIKNRKNKLEPPSKFVVNNTLSEEDKKFQINYKFNKNIKFSIVVPLYNTPENFLKEMIESVQKQTYGNWELCLADGSDNKHEYVATICKNYQKNDNRIKYLKLTENLGISENTNAAIEMSTGEYIGLFDHDDLLHPSVLYYYMHEICSKNADILYCDELTFEGTIDNVTVVHYKPDFAIDSLRGVNYICHFTVFNKELLKKTGGFRKEFDGSQDHDMIFRLTEQTNNIVHVPKILYFWRSHPNSVAMDIGSKTYAIDAGKKAVQEHIKRCGQNAIVESSRAIPSIYRIKYAIEKTPLVSILIPNKDQTEILKRCIDSITELSTYKNYEIIIVENNSATSEIFDYYKTLEKIDNINVVYWKEDFNYSKINNFGFTFCKGEQIILLNNDMEIISPNWIEEMLMLNQRDDVGATGAMLYYPNDTIQHAGVILGIGGVAGHSHKHFPRVDFGYMGRLCYTQNLSAVTAACLMVKRKVFEELNGLDPLFKVAFNDVDFCMRIRQAGYLICWTPHSELYHHESLSRGHEDTPEKQARFSGEVNLFLKRWGTELEKGDPYYNPNLTLVHENFTMK